MYSSLSDYFKLNDQSAIWFQMQNKWSVLVCSDSYLDYGQSAAPPVGLADKPGR